MTCRTCRDAGCILDWGITFCRCPVGRLAEAFHHADARAYFAWMREHLAHEYEGEANDEARHHD